MKTVKLIVSEGNDLIAEFMGRGNEIHVDVFFNYHTSYDELLPVLEKIEQCRFVHETIIQYDDVYKHHSCMILPALKDTFTSFHQKSKDCKRNAIYLAIVQFIKWYNDSQNQTQP
jgi:hypothetical protein